MPRKAIRPAADSSVPSPVPSSTPSKSQRKRDAHRSQALGEALIDLSAANLARLPLWPALKAAIADAQGLVRIARRRQIRYIGRLLREGDEESVAQALEEVRNPGWRERARHLRLERLLQALLEGDEALSDLHERSQDIDMQHLRQLILAARRERKAEAAGQEEIGQDVEQGVEQEVEQEVAARKGGDKHRRRLFRFLVRSGLET
ncbi:ribosome biogenesis factor YjgA [Thioalkalivibrio sp. HK1]|uniref:ribosome biogenesis factor YjgA n=1 Tax=Thioalkalivibrio sp. HK1 TaxID=1469245 RepID=UPI0004701776|nr:ribosome biogenesis factor YjgA [Thioalkalivibrio sp. HK1]